MARDETILVTGVSGFVGAAVARVMAADGWRVRGFARPTSPATNLQNFPGEIVRGDMLDRASIERALEGCTALAHVAADYRLWAPDPEEIVHHNREGTRAVMEAALAAGVKRIVYTSSVATIAPLEGGAAGEDRPLTERTAIGAYKRSKVVAERLVERMVAEQGLPAVIVNPSTPIGPRDVRPTPTGRILVEAATGKIPAFVDTGLNLVHVDDVARGHLLALEKGVPGRRYILGGEDVSLQEMLAEVATLVGRKPPTIRLPRLPLMPLAAVSEAWGRMTGREPMLTRDALRMAKYRMFFSSERAKAELGYTARPWREAVADALGWFRQEGHDRMMLIGLLSLLVWLGMLAFRDGFWLARDTDEGMAPAPAHWPSVTAVVPARDEAAVIGQAIGSLIAQDYPGQFRIVLVDDGSSDGTAQIAREAAAKLGSDRLTVIAGSAPPAGWTGKLWAMRNGIEEAGAAPGYLWLTDADIAHQPDTLRSLVARSEQDGLVLNSLMAELLCSTFAEKALIPAFVFFFQMLYPFRRVNRPTAKMAAAAGGCMLVKRQALSNAGGVAVIADAIIDDCAMGATMKRQGPIRLSLTRRSASIRPYGGWREVGMMIARSAYAQLGYSPWLLLGTLIGMVIVYVAPPLLALFGHGGVQIAGALAWATMAVCLQPMLRFYRRSPLWGLALPLIGMFYAGATWFSAWRHWQGRGGMWKGRAQARMQS